MDMSAALQFNGLTRGFSALQAERCDALASARVVMKLDPYRVALLHARGAVEIACVSGQLWITRPGESDDLVLQAGQTHILQPARDIVLSTAGARCPASFGIRPAGRVVSRWPFAAKADGHFQVAFA